LIKGGDPGRLKPHVVSPVSRGQEGWSGWCGAAAIETRMSCGATPLRFVIMAHLVTDSQSGCDAEYPYAPRPPLLGQLSSPVEPKLDFWKTNRFSFLAAGLVLVFAVADFSILPISEFVDGDDWTLMLVGALCGAMFAQAALLSIFLCFTSGSFWRRLIVCWLAAAISWAIWIAGLAVAVLISYGQQPTAVHEGAEAMQFFGLALPLAGLAVQSPLWFFRLYLGWQLHTPAASQTPVRPLSIQDYLVGTGIAAASLTLARLAPPSKMWVHENYWQNWASFFAVAAAISAFSVAPALLLLFRLRRWQLGYGLLALYGSIGGAVVIGLIIRFAGPPPNLWPVLAVVVVFLSFALFLGAGLKAMRDLGFQLVLGQRRVIDAARHS